MSTIGNVSGQISSFFKSHLKESSIHPVHHTSSTFSKFRTHVPIGHQDDFWGTPVSMQGQLGPVCVFNDALNERQGLVLNNVGQYSYHF